MSTNDRTVEEEDYLSRLGSVKTQKKFKVHDNLQNSHNGVRVASFFDNYVSVITIINNVANMVTLISRQCCKNEV